MIDRAEMTERHARILKRLSLFGESVVEQVVADVAAAPTPDARREAVKTFHTISRSVRQTLALEARFERDQRRTEIESRMDAERVAEHDVETRQAARKTAVRRTVEHLIWHEWDLSEPQAERLLRDVEIKLTDADFDLSDPVEDQILLLCRRLGYNPVEPDDDEEDEDDDDEDVAVLTARPGRGASG